MSELGPLITFAVVLTVGLLGGEVAARARLPRVTGWILTGVVLRAVDLPVLAPDRLAAFGPFSQLVLGYIAFTVGSHLHIRSLINAHKRLVLLVLTEMIVTPLVVLSAMRFIGDVSLEESLLFAAIAVAGAPGTTVIVIREARARGVFVKTLIAAVALIDMVAVCFFVIVEEELKAGPATYSLLVNGLPAVLRTVAIAVGVGLGAAGVSVAMTRAIVGPRLLGASLVASILLAWGVAEWAGVSSILAVTFLGVALANLITDKERAGEAYLNTYGSVLFTAFYTFAGLRLNFAHVLPLAMLIAVFFVGRLVAKWLSAYLAMTLAQAPKHVRYLLGPALLPHGGVAVGLIIAVQADPNLAAYGDNILTVGLSALAINQLIGPSATRWALFKANEAGLDRPRLLDFIREQDILVGLRNKSPKAALERLSLHLYKTHDLSADRETFLKGLLEREEEAWYLGEGLAIPHQRIEMGEDMAGVIGLSKEGFDWDTPDGKKVHAIVLLASPTNQRDRHLEVIAAFARIVSREASLRDQFYHASSAAHAYNILHAEDVAEFNYFLDDALHDDDATTSAREAT